MTDFVPLYSALSFSHFALLSRTRGAPSGRPEKSISTGGKADRVAVAQDADVELAALDVLLGERGVVELLVDRGDPLHQGVGVADQGVGADADRGVGPQGLDEQRHASGCRRSRSRPWRRRRSRDTGSCRRRAPSWPAPCPGGDKARRGRRRCSGRRPGRGGRRPPTSPRTFWPNISRRLKTRSGLRRLRPEMSLPRSPWTPKIDGRVPPLAERLGHLIDDDVVRLGVFAVQVRQDRDLHRSPLGCRAIVVAGWSRGRTQSRCQGPGTADCPPRWRPELARRSCHVHARIRRLLPRIGPAGDADPRPRPDDRRVAAGADPGGVLGGAGARRGSAGSGPGSTSRRSGACPRGPSPSRSPSTSPAPT